jgi:hypothetical protein
MRISACRVEEQLQIEHSHHVAVSLGLTHGGKPMQSLAFGVPRRYGTVIWGADNFERFRCKPAYPALVVNETWNQPARTGPMSDRFTLDSLDSSAKRMPDQLAKIEVNIHSQAAVRLTAAEGASSESASHSARA